MVTAMQGLITEGQEVIDEDMEPEVKDAASDRGSPTCRALRNRRLRMCSDIRSAFKEAQKIAQLLQQTLDEEGKTDKALTQLALKINVEAEDPAADKPAPKKSASLTKKILHAVGMD